MIEEDRQMSKEPCISLIVLVDRCSKCHARNVPSATFLSRIPYELSQALSQT